MWLNGNRDTERRHTIVEHKYVKVRRKRLAILEKEVWVVLGTRNDKHFEKLGYDIPKIKNKSGKLAVPRGTKISVKVEDLPKSSMVKLTKICDDCGKLLLNQTFDSISRSREKSNGIDRCHKCAAVINGNFQKENPSYEKTLEYYALTNDREYLLSEFSEKNTKTPKDISHGSADDYLWDCPTCKGEYDMKVVLRTLQNCNCPYCNGKRVLKGFNDLWTTHPHVAEFLKDEQRGYEITAGSNKKESYKCCQCGFEKKMTTNNVVNQGISCLNCSDGVSYPEKFVFEYLNQLNIDFEYQRTFNWSKNISHTKSKLSGDKRYDFYIPTQNTIIEAHGEQHLKHGFRKGSKIRTLEEEQENDRLKEEIAVKNGIENYIMLDCSKSELVYIKNSILLSGLSTMFSLENIDWLKCHEKACHSLVRIVCDLWNQGNRTLEIKEITKLDRSTVGKYLKQGKILGWCDYDPKEVMKEVAKYRKTRTKEIVQLTLEGQFIKYWESMTQVQRILGIETGNISAVCKRKKNNAGGFKWMYKEDYEDTDPEEIKKEIAKLNEINLRRRMKEVVQFTQDGKFVRYWESMTQVQRILGISISSITMACKGTHKQAGGFKWMYKKDYEALLE
jgi:hypothetical protein